MLFVWLLQASQGIKFWIGLVVAGVTLLFSSWITFGNLSKVAKRMVQLEADINSRAGEELLVWETKHGGGLTGFWMKLRLPLANLASPSETKKDAPSEK